MPVTSIRDAREVARIPRVIPFALHPDLTTRDMLTMLVTPLYLWRTDP